jgi:hypothetical protein
MAEPLPDRLQDATILRATQTERYAVSLSRRILAMLEELETGLVAQLQRRDLDPTVPIRTAFQRRRLEALLTETRKQITAHYREMYRETRGELVEFAGVEQAATVQLLNAEIGASLLRPGIAAPGVLRALVDTTFISGGATQAAPLKGWFGRQAASTQQRIAAAIRAGMLHDETVGQLVRRLRGTKAAQYKDGILAASYRETEGIVRTAVLGVQNTARETTWKAYPDVVRGVAAVTTLDSRTCLYGETRIYTPLGTPPIQVLAVGDRVFGGSGAICHIVATKRTQTKQIAIVRLSNGRSVVCTPDHQFLTESGWVEARYLKENQRLMERNALE